MGRFGRCLLVLIPSLIQSRLAIAEDVERIDSGFSTKLVTARAAGALEAGVAPAFRYGNKQSAIEVPISLHTGLTDQLQVGAVWTAIINLNSEPGVSGGAGDLEITAKYSVFDVADLPIHSAFALSTAFPVGDRATTSGNFRLEPSLVLAQDLDAWLPVELFQQIGVSIAAGAREGMEEAQHGLITRAGFYVRGGGIVPILEIGRTAAVGGDVAWLLSGGVSIKSTDGVTVGLGTRIALDESAEQFRLVLDVAYPL